MYLKVEVNNNCLCQQQGQCNLSQFNNTLTLISTAVVLIIQDDNEYIVVAYEAVSSMIMSLAVVTTLTEMFWCMMTFQKKCHTVFLTVSTINKNQHTLTLNQNCIAVQWLMSSYLIQCDTVLYEQNVVTEQSENDHCLKEVSIQSKLLLINLENRIDINICTDESDNISVVQDKNPTSCQLWDTYLYDTYMMIVVNVVVAAELVIQESVLKCVNQERFHIQEMRMKKLKKKEKEIWEEEW